MSSVNSMKPSAPRLDPVEGPSRGGGPESDPGILRPAAAGVTQIHVGAPAINI